MDVILLFEDKVIKTNSNAINRSSLLVYLNNSYPNEEIKLNFNYALSKKIIEWLERHEKINPIIPPFPNDDYNYRKIFTIWEIEFFSSLIIGNDISLFVEFMNLINNFEIPEMLNQACYYLTCFLGNISWKEYMDLFKIEQNFENSDLSSIQSKIDSEIQEKMKIDKIRSLKDGFL